MLSISRSTVLIICGNEAHQGYRTEIEKQIYPLYQPVHNINNLDIEVQYTIEIIIKTFAVVIYMTLCFCQFYVLWLQWILPLRHDLKIGRNRSLQAFGNNLHLTLSKNGNVTLYDVLANGYYRKNTSLRVYCATCVCVLDSTCLLFICLCLPVYYQFCLSTILKVNSTQPSQRVLFNMLSLLNLGIIAAACKSFTVMLIEQNHIHHY